MKVAAAAGDGGGTSNCLRGFEAGIMGTSMVVQVSPLGHRYCRKRRVKWRPLGFGSQEQRKKKSR